MSDDWAKKLGEQARQRGGDEQSAREHQRYRAQTLRTKAPDLWREITETAGRAVAQFNEGVGAGSKDAIDYFSTADPLTPFGMQLYRTIFPAIHLRPRLDVEDLSVRIECTRHADHDNRKEDRPVRLPLELDTNDKIYILDGEQRLNAEEFARKLLGYFA